MTKKESIADWQRMFDSLTKPDEIAKTKRQDELRKIKENKKKDVGL